MKRRADPMRRARRRTVPLAPILVRTLAPAIYAAALLSGLYTPARAFHPLPILLLVAFTGYFAWRIHALATRPEAPERERVEVGLLAVLALSTILEIAALPTPWPTAAYGILLVGMASSVPLPGILALPLAALALRDGGFAPWLAQTIHLELVALTAGVVVTVERKGRKKALRVLDKFRLDTEHLDAKDAARAVPGAPHDLARLDELLYACLGQVKENAKAHGAVLTVLTPRGDLYVRELVSDSPSIREDSILKLDAPTLRWIIENRKPLRIGRLRTPASGLGYYNGTVSVRSFLGVPVTDGDQVEGVLALDSLREDAFTEADQAMLMVASHQVATTLTQIRAHEQEKRKARDFKLLHEFSKRSNDCLTSSELLASLLGSAHERLQPEFSAIALLAADGALRFETVGQGRWAALEGVSFDPKQGLAGWVLDGGQYLFYDEGRQAARRPVFAHGVAVPEFESLMLHAMETQGQKLGVLCLGAETARAFDPSAVNFCELLAQLGAQLLLQIRHRVELEALATTDALTGLANRRVFFQRLEEEVKRSYRYEHGVALLLLDVDHFKKINDRHGHPAGDEVLRVIARTLQSLARETDLVARYGGEEFAVLLPNTGSAGAAPLAERIRAGIAALDVGWDKVRIPVRASIGLAELDGDGDSAHKLVTRSDQALYAAKQTGRDRVVEFSEIRQYLSWGS